MPVTQPPAPARSSYAEAVRSTALIGGASAINLVLGLVRNKWLAVQLGPMGLGWFTNYNQIVQMVSALAGLGLNNSGVRQVAEAEATGDKQNLARTIVALRRVAWVCAALGGALLILLAPWLATFTFQDAGQAAAIRWLGLAVFLGAISGAQAALIQGLRRVGHLARLNVLGALAATVASIPAVWFWEERGIIPFMLAVAGMTVLASWWYARRVRVPPVAYPWRETWRAAGALLSLGAAMMLSTLMVAGVGYLTRVLIQRHLGLEAAGHYHAASLLATYCVNFILQGLGADFFPRLTAVARDHAAMGRLLNEQTEVSLLISGPAITGALALAPALLVVINSPAILPALPCLRWLLLGTVLRVASWLLSFVVLAKGNARLYVLTEAGANLLMLGTTWFGVNRWGLVGAGVAFAATYLVYWLFMLGIARRLIGFRFSSANHRVLLLILGATAIAFAVPWCVPAPWDTAVGVTLSAGLSVHCANLLAALAPECLPARLWRSLKARLGLLG
jgi:PST family polysaccharide transporter